MGKDIKVEKKIKLGKEDVQEVKINLLTLNLARLELQKILQDGNIKIQQINKKYSESLDKLKEKYNIPENYLLDLEKMIAYKGKTKVKENGNSN